MKRWHEETTIMNQRVRLRRLFSDLWHGHEVPDPYLQQGRYRKKNSLSQSFGSDASRAWRRIEKRQRIKGIRRESMAS